jgi:tetratricopeptide (TPR) repeat protein
MKTRTFIVVLFLLILAITIGLSAYVAITLPQKTAPAEVSTPVATTTPIATATTAPTLKDTITNTEGTIFDPIVAALDYLAVVLIAVLIIVVVKLVWDYSGKTNLVIDAFTNATGDDTLDKVQPGLNQLTRKKLAEALEVVRKDINEYNEPGLEQLSESPPPETTSNEQLSNLFKSLTDVSPGNTKTAVQLLSLVFGPSGTKVVTTLHCLGDASVYGTLGIGLEIIDLQGRKETVSQNFWEKGNDLSLHVRRRTGVSHILEGVLNLVPWNPQRNKQTEPKQALEQRYLHLVDPAAYWLAVELAFRSMEKSRRSIRLFLRSAWKNITFQNIKTRFKKSGEWKSSYQARLYNFIGYYHLNNAQNYSTYGYSYDLAIQAFNKATSLDKYQILPKIWVVSRPWFLPYENLGVTYLIIAQEKIQQLQPLQLTKEGIDDIYEALSNLRKAQELFQQHKNKQPISDDKLNEMEQLLKLYIGIAKLLSANDILIKESINDILGTPAGWNLNSKINFRLLYNLACWYGVAYSIGHSEKDARLVDAQQQARCIIVRSLARKVDFWYSAAHDPSLKDIAEQKDWDKLKSILKRKQYSIHNPDLSDSEYNDFAIAIDGILQELEWKQ